MNPWYLVALIWLSTLVVLSTWRYEQRTPDQRYMDALARKDRRRRGDRGSAREGILGVLVLLALTAIVLDGRLDDVERLEDRVEQLEQDVEAQPDSEAVRYQP